MPQGTVRIIAGKWRGRKLQVPNLPGLRPTPDRVRETLFNWLASILPEAYCLDAFAGSGVLGFEALSRGAAHVVMVDQSREVVQLLQKEMTNFGGEHATIYAASLPQGLKPPAHRFDVVFLDPPYQQNLLLPMCHLLEEKKWLAKKAYIYLEAEKTLRHDDLPLGWTILKSKTAGQVSYHLACREQEK